MSKIYYKHGTMCSGKTAELVMAIDRYNNYGRKSIVLAPKINNRNIKIKSRAIDTEIEPIKFSDLDNISDIIIKINSKNKLDAVFIDECQFLTKMQVEKIAKLEIDVPILCYGLKNTYVIGELFEGTQALLYWASDIREIKSICAYCNSKSTQNLRIINGKPTYNGEAIKIGDVNSNTNEYYLPVCNKHYFKPKI